MLPNLGRKVTVFTLNNDEELRNAFTIGSSKKELDILVDGGYESSDGKENDCQNDVNQQELELAEPSKRSDGQELPQNLPSSMPQNQNKGQGKRKKPSSPFIFFSATVCKDLRQSQQDIDDFGKHTLTQKEIGEKWNSLPEHDKQPYKEMAMLDAQQFAKEKAPQLPKPRKIYMQNRIALPSIEKVLQKFTRQQREAIKSMGLGGLLELRCIRLHHDLLEWLVENFDPSRCLLRVHGRELFLTIKEVQRLLGIHGCGSDIMLVGFSDEAFKKLCDDLKLEGGVITLTDLGASLSPSNNVTLEFKRKFVLYMLGSFLCPTSQPYVTKNYVHVVRDVDTLNGRNWAKLTLQYLTNGISELRRLGSRTPNGCLFLLEVHVNFRVFGKGNQTSPTKKGVPLVGEQNLEKMENVMEIVKGQLGLVLEAFGKLQEVSRPCKEEHEGVEDGKMVGKLLQINKVKGGQHQHHKRTFETPSKMELKMKGTPVQVNIGIPKAYTTPKIGQTTKRVIFLDDVVALSSETGSEFGQNVTASVLPKTKLVKKIPLNHEKSPINGKPNASPNEVVDGCKRRGRKPKEAGDKIQEGPL
ncbi:hypothetical protein Vadar_007482 [Vaccinium darrowii]|uniref:Uncharacterized protein n=1 Tax=Vaccinium darrowii TaxID=229202 RepID=A0ACB7YEC9_9ERIC|nr:hypothetical protein Vadar_007482 [Vaccinium darrowii]